MNYSTDDNDDRYDFWDYCGDKLAEEAPEVDPEDALRCESCHAEVAELVPCAWDTKLMVGACCEFPEEPECQCHMDGDSYDPRSCELHDSSSTWNVRMSAIREDAAALVAPILPQLEAAVERKPVVSSACPFCHSTRVGQSGPFSECGNCKQIWNPLAKGKVA